MSNKFEQTSETALALKEEWRNEIDRANARMRHFRGVAASVVKDAILVFEEVWEACQDPRTPEQIIDGIELPPNAIPTCTMAEFMEKLNLLGNYLDYARRLLDGSLEKESEEESEV